MNFKNIGLTFKIENELVKLLVFLGTLMLGVLLTVVSALAVIAISIIDLTIKGIIVLSAAKLLGLPVLAALTLPLSTPTVLTYLSCCLTVGGALEVVARAFSRH